MSGRNNYIVKRYVSSPETTNISVAGVNILEDIFPDEYSKKNLKKFSLINQDDCVVIVNEVDEIKLKALYGLELQFETDGVWSLVFKDSGIDYYWLGAY